MYACVCPADKRKARGGRLGRRKEEREKKVKMREERGHKGSTNKNKDEGICREECGAKGRGKK